ncbi:hypothetical protein [Gallibacterium sp. AGMB14963]|uniref:hypothetical protein n=1 Tax=Gallibacterium faecale TaxID=3019086 RepID=UPI0022F169DD|nr:hypothetical protein [Gallibacterium sp. AGMB14963]MDA3977577.1 hypothetical protein [Gallibacterium sp. AGMB14963]
MNNKWIKCINFDLPIELIAYQYNERIPSIISFVPDLENICLSRKEAKLFLNWLFSGLTSKYWKQYVIEGQQCYVDDKTDRCPYVIMMPLVVFRYEFCQWSKEKISQDMQLLLDILFMKTISWRKSQADTIAITFYLES